jgi:hypothetical protein
MDSGLVVGSACGHTCWDWQAGGPSLGTLMAVSQLDAL